MEQYVIYVILIILFTYFCFLSIINQYYIDLIPKVAQEE